ncbi:MAG: hypothetical protein IT342_25520 [Candidatus Melainabacteria bacterium]|nr:hypothetical protein [Candidatus Melainabacteria bacterium]
MIKLTKLGTKWRGMTVSSIPGLVLWIVIGLAIAVTMLLPEHVAELKSPPEASPKYSETDSGGK